MVDLARHGVHHLLTLVPADLQGLMELLCHLIIVHSRLPLRFARFGMSEHPPLDPLIRISNTIMDLACLAKAAAAVLPVALLPRLLL